jgi:hypothetical protein
MKKQTINKLKISKTTLTNLNAQHQLAIAGGERTTKTVPQTRTPDCETALNVCGGLTQVQSLCSNLGICCA